MAYTPKTWQCGEPIMADDLNHMEQGIAQGGSGGKVFQIVGQGTCNGQTYYEFDFTYQDALDAIANVTTCWSHLTSGGYALILYSNPHMVNGVYAVDVVYVNPSGGGGNTPSLTAMTVYSDTEDGNLRTYNCWAEPAPLN